jgi:hypothetical protein
MKNIYTRVECTMGDKTYIGAAIGGVDDEDIITKKDIIETERKAIKNLLSKIGEYKYFQNERS